VTKMGQAREPTRQRMGQEPGRRDQGTRHSQCMECPFRDQLDVQSKSSAVQHTAQLLWRLASTKATALVLGWRRSLIGAAKPCSGLCS